MKASRQIRSSSMYTTQSQLQNSNQMTSSKALIHNPMRSTIRGRTNTNQGVRKSTNQFPVIQDTKKNDDQYIEKLHGHISFLNESIVKMKNEQTDYKTQMMNMMHPQNDKKVVDHAINTQEKFKAMKQKLIEEIHTLQHQNLLINNEINALSLSKKYIEEEIDEMDVNDGQLLIQFKDNIDKSRSQYNVQKDRREEKDKMVWKLEADFEKIYKEYNDISLQRKNKMLIERFDEQNYNVAREVEDIDIEEKEKVIDELQVVIDKCNARQAQDKHYNKALEKNAELKEQLAEEEAELDRVIFDSQILEENIKYCQMRKDQGVIEYQNLKSELEKYKQLQQQIDNRNETKVKNTLENTQGDELRQMHRKLRETMSKQRELKGKAEKMEKEFREMSLFISQKELKLDILSKENDIKQYEFEDYVSRINDLKARHDELMTEISSDIEKEMKLKKELHRIQPMKLQDEEQRIYLKAVRDKLQEKVKLEEEMRKVQVEQLKSTTYDNEQFNSNVHHFYSNWGNMYRFGKQQEL